MNARIQSNQVRTVAMVAAVLMSLGLFQGVASMGDWHVQQAGVTFVAQAEATAAQR